LWLGSGLGHRLLDTLARKAAPDANAISAQKAMEAAARCIARAHRCFQALVSRRVASIAELAAIEGVDDRYVSNVLARRELADDFLRALEQEPTSDWAAQLVSRSGPPPVCS
jgi:hypothetical protein